MTILEAMIDVAVKLDATAQSIKNLVNVMNGIADKTKGVPAIEAFIVDPPCQQTEEKVTIQKEESEVTIEQVRAIMAEKSQEGLTAKVKELLESFGAPKLSAVKPEDYAKLIIAAKALK